MKEALNISEIYASKVFDESTMKERLPKRIYAELQESMETGEEMDYHVAEIVANVMKDWAIENGATHYTHWFQPLNGVTAEKHESFISPIENGKVMMEFSAKELIRGEADGSSLPSGGLRATFEARGYSSWDTSSPAFIHEYPDGGSILCIPTIFCSFTGETLDKKTPLLRSMEAINKQALRIIRIFGDNEAKKVNSNVGAEQEYFILDKATRAKRTDLVFAGRTLFGAPSPKGQELSDHYFGSIKDRIAAFMADVNKELWELGVMAKTQHNEVAPAQHEIVPMFENANLATDHNQIIMDTLKRVALRHDLACLLHEKPFAGINGSGKHNNWSLTTDTGVNLLDPGKENTENPQFLLIITAIVRAVDKYAPLLRQSVSSSSNDLRLGGNEAPPAIISIFIGEKLEESLEKYCEGENGIYNKQDSVLDFDVTAVQYIKKDSTDRNRTSPFAYTGNKFEYRMVGSSASVADSTTTLNTIVADAFKEAADYIEAREDKMQAVHDLIKEWYSEHRRVVFNGNGYSKEWYEEAEKRGLPNITNAVDAIGYLESDEAIKIFEKHGVLTKTELLSRMEIAYEGYANMVNIEANAALSMIKREIIPAVIRYLDMVTASWINLKNVEISNKAVDDIIKRVNKNLNGLYDELTVLEEVTAKLKNGSSEKERAIIARDEVRTSIDRARVFVDELECTVGADYWPYPTYAELLFNV